MPAHRRRRVQVSGPLDLPYRPGAPDEFIAELWASMPACPVDVLLGVLQPADDGGQIQIQLRDPQVRPVIIVPGQVLHAADPGDPRTFTVLSPPATAHLRLPQ